MEEISNQSGSQSRFLSEIKEEILFNFDKETYAKQRDLLDNVNLLDESSESGSVDREDEDPRTERYLKILEDEEHDDFNSLDMDDIIKLPDEWNNLDIHVFAAKVESCGADPFTVEETFRQHHQPVLGVQNKVKIIGSTSSATKESPVKLPDDWRILDIHDLAAKVESYGTDPIIVKETFRQYQQGLKNSVARKIIREHSPERKPIMLPTNWRDKTREDLIADICAENSAVDREALQNNILTSEQSSKTSHPSPAKLPPGWPRMTIEELEEVTGVSLGNKISSLEQSSKVLSSPALAKLPSGWQRMTIEELEAVTGISL